jgi:hypothetical protein
VWQQQLQCVFKNTEAVGETEKQPIAVSKKTMKF